MSFDRVPQELTDYILDFVQDHRTTLNSCLHVSRSFAEASRYHLYRDIDIHGRGESTAVQARLAQLRRLIQSPRTARYIRRLSIWSYPSPDKNRNMAAFIPVPFDLLELVLTQLQSLQHLQLKYVYITNGDHGSSSYPSPPPSPLQSCFRRTLQSLELEGVAMDDLEMVLPTILSLAKPSSLSTSAVFPAKPNAVKSRRPSLPFLLHPAPTASLRLMCVSDECIQGLMSTLSDGHLRSLTIEGPHGPGRSVELLGELFQNISTSLEELEMSEYMFRGKRPMVFTFYSIFNWYPSQAHYHGTKSL